MKPPIVLLTDYGLQDPYAGVLHRVIASSAPEVPVIDLTHGIEPQNIRQASIYLESSFRYFPKGSIFVCVVDPGVGTGRAILCLKTKSYYFLAPDNGLLSGLMESEPVREIREFRIPRYALKKVSATFHGRDLFAPAASALALRPSCFKTFGPVCKKIISLKPLLVLKTSKLLTGEVIYFDHFGNAVTSIQRTDAPETFWVSAQVHADSKKIGPLVKTYGGDKMPVALWNSANRLEIAVPKGKMSALLKTGTVIKVQREK